MAPWPDPYLLALSEQDVDRTSQFSCLDRARAPDDIGVQDVIEVRHGVAHGDPLVGFGEKRAKLVIAVANTSESLANDLYAPLD